MAIWRKGQGSHRSTVRWLSDGGFNVTSDEGQGGDAAMSRIMLKRALKRTAGWTAVMLQSFHRRSTPSACILMYHRVADIGFIDPEFDDWNVSPDAFEHQIRSLSPWVEWSRLEDLPRRLAEPNDDDRPIVSVTFDDGYANFHSKALPTLLRYDVPASVFVVTGSIGQEGSMPFDAWSRKNSHRLASQVCRPMTWDEVQSCVESGLVTVGSHSHRHLKGTECCAEQFEDEANTSREILRSRLGSEHGNVFAYPYGSSRLGFVPASYRDAVRTAGYAMAVSTDLGVVTAESDVFRLPRIEANCVDTPSVIRAKALGAVMPYRIVDRMRSAIRPI